MRFTAQALGRRVLRLHNLAQPMVTSLQSMEGFGITFPSKADQVLRLNEDKAFSHAEAADAFGYIPMAREQGIRQDLALLHSGGDGLSF